MSNVTISTTGLDADYCFTTPQQYAIDLAASLQGNFATGTVLNTGNATPSAENSNKPWFRYNSDGTPDKWYVFSSGLWLSRHPLPPGSVMMYQGSEASIDTFDGGEVAAITPVTGPMWEKVDAMDGRSPIGPGTLPSGLVVNLGDSLGEETHAISIDELPVHHHTLIGSLGSALSGGDEGAVLNEVDGQDEFPKNTEDTGGGDPVSLVHPVYAIWTIQRTSRLYYRV